MRVADGAREAFEDHRQAEAAGVDDVGVSEHLELVGGPLDGRVRFGHPSGVLGVGAEARYIDGQWVVTKALMSRSARVLMEGWVAVPG